MQRCKHCLLPSSVPGSGLDSSGVCILCRTYEPAQATQNDAVRKAREADLEATLRGVRGDGAYDVLVCLSGGKDSLYLLHRAKVDYKLRVLAFTTDANIADVAWSNIRLAVDKLGVDHLIYRPSSEFYRRLFRFLLQNQEERGAVYTVSYVYAPLFEGDALAAATERNIPLVLAGYSPGQPEKERMEYEFSRKLICETDWLPPGLLQAAEFSNEDRARFWNPRRYPKGTQFPRYLAPFHAWEYDQERTMQAVVDLRFVARRAHASPVHSNYPVNWLLMYSDLRHFGYNPYAPEFASLIRTGKANLLQWKFMAPFVDFMIKRKILLGREIVRQLSYLGLQEADLRITRPHGAYDPPIS